MAEQLNRFFGIDLGTTFSCIAYVDEYARPVVVPNAETERITPSVVFFDGNSVTVGTVARQHAKLYPQAVVEMVKRSMGDPNFLFEYGGQTYRPEEISSFILRKVVGDAEQTVRQKIIDVVITCPAYFGVNQREATERAGRIAGLNVRAILNEPTAAAIAYGLEKSADQTVLVYDLGGGTFDITMIQVRGGTITVLCTGGDHDLGGKDWDRALVTHLAHIYQERTRTTEDILLDPMVLQELYTQAEQAKKTLTQREATKVAVTAGQRVVVDVTRANFDALTLPLLERTIRLTHDMLAEASQKGHCHFDRILLVGGSTRMPQVVKRLQTEFPAVPVESYDPDEAVAKGAAIYAWKLAIDQEIKTAVADQTGEDAYTLDLDLVDPQVVESAVEGVARQFNLRLPAVKKAVATKVTNVTSKTFGIVALDAARQEKVFNLIRRNDAVPAIVTQTFGTAEADQELVEIKLMENLGLGLLEELAASTELGRAELRLPPGLPANAPIAVKFSLTEQGRLEVTATEARTEESVRLTVQTASVMSEEEVEQARSRALAIAVS